MTHTSDLKASIANDTTDFTLRDAYCLPALAWRLGCGEKECGEMLRDIGQRWDKKGVQLKACLLELGRHVCGDRTCKPVRAAPSHIDDFG